MIGKDDMASGRQVSDEERIPVVEERLVTQKVVREGRTVTVTTRPVTQEVTVSEPVLRERVLVERVPVGAVVDEIPQIREDGELTVIPVVEERVRLVRELVLVEEVHLRRERREELHEETVTTTRTQVAIDNGDQS